MELIAYAAGESQYPPLSLWSLVLGSTLQCILHRAEKVVFTITEQGLVEMPLQNTPDPIASYNRVIRDHIERTKAVLSVACQPKDLTWFGYAKATALKSTPRLLFSAITIAAASLNLLPFGPLGFPKAEESLGAASESHESDGFLILGFHDRLWPGVQDVLIRVGLVDIFATFFHTHSSTLLSYPELSLLRPVIDASTTLISSPHTHDSSCISDFLVAIHGVAWVPLLHSSSVLSQAFRGIEKCQFSCSTSVSRWVMHQRTPAVNDDSSITSHQCGTSVLALEASVARICNTLMLRLARHRQSRLSDSELTFNSGMGMLSDWEEEFASEFVPLPMSISCRFFLREDRLREAYGACTARYIEGKPLCHIKVDAHEHTLSRMRMRMRYCKKPLVARPAESIDEDALACASDGDCRAFETRPQSSASTADFFPVSITGSRRDFFDISPTAKVCRVDGSWESRNSDPADELSSSMIRAGVDDAPEFDAVTTEIDAETEMVGRSVVSSCSRFKAQHVRAAVQRGMRSLNLRCEVGNQESRDRSTSDADSVMVQSTPSVIQSSGNTDTGTASKAPAQDSSGTAHRDMVLIESSPAVSSVISQGPTVQQASALRSSEDIVVTPPIHTNDLKIALDCEYVRPMQVLLIVFLPSSELHVYFCLCQVVRGIFSIAQKSVCFYVPNVRRRNLCLLIHAYMNIA
jgi:hypothetical protein